MNEVDIEHRLTENEQRSKSNTYRLNKLEPIVNEIHTMSETMVRLVSEVQHTNENVAEIKDKVETMEQEPAKRWKESTKAIFNAFLGAIGTAIAGGLIYILTMMK